MITALGFVLGLMLAEPLTSAAAGPRAEEGPLRTPEVAPGLQALDRRRHRIQLVGMGTLTGWAIANIVGGVVGNLATPPSDARYFHQMNALWNTVNLTLGAIGLRSAIRERPTLGRRPGVVAEIGRTQRVFAVNALLDVVYMLGGYVTWEVGKDFESARVRGYGAAVIFQGAFLMAFDLAMIGAHERNLRRVASPRVAVLPTAGGGLLSLSGRF